MFRLTSLSLLVLGLLLGSPAAAQPDPVLLVLSNQDFYYPDYGPLRTALEAEGLTVQVAAPTLAPAIPHGGAPEETVIPDLALADAIADDYSALVLIGGWGSAQFQPEFPGTYANQSYQPDAFVSDDLTVLVADLLAQDKPVGAICFAVAGLAWIEVDGQSLLAGREVVGYAGNGPSFTLDGQSAPAVSTRWHVEQNGGFMHASGAVGDPTTSTDDVIVDGNIITAENFHSGPALASELGQVILVPPELPGPKRVLMVISNYHFWFREYDDPRTVLENAGIEVTVAATELATCYPHANSGQGGGSGEVEPDMSLAEARATMESDPDSWDAIAFVGGWGSSRYQAFYDGTYVEPQYNGIESAQVDVIELINEFNLNGKWVTALCHGVTILAYAHFDGASILNGRTVVAWPGQAPQELDEWGFPYQRLTRDHVEENGAIMLPTNSVGDPMSPFDDVVIDGNVITGESFDAAWHFGEVLRDQLLAE